jgi:flagella basal body P-ring formation protein FlgA
MLVAWLVLTSCYAAANAAAAEIVLRPHASPTGSIVRLGDIAELRGAAGRVSGSLAETPLTPAPAPGTKQFLSVREIRDLLQASGVSLAGHRLSGAAQVVVERKTPDTLRRRVGRLTDEQLAQVEEELRESIRRHLLALAEVDEPWVVATWLESEQLRQLAEAPVPWTIEGGREPWIGPQELTIAYETPGGKGSMTILADVAQPEPIVVLTRAISRGETLTRADVALALPPSRERALSRSGFVPQGNSEQAPSRSTSRSDSPHARPTDEPLRSLEDAIGKVARRSLQQGQPLAPSMLEEPTLVHRGETVKVVALAHGIRVTTEARAKQSGAAGELIYVETLQAREPFAAQVSGRREVQVIGR